MYETYVLHFFVYLFNIYAMNDCLKGGVMVHLTFFITSRSINIVYATISELCYDDVSIDYYLLFAVVGILEIYLVKLKPSLNQALYIYVIVPAIEGLCLLLESDFHSTSL